MHQLGRQMVQSRASLSTTPYTPNQHTIPSKHEEKQTRKTEPTHKGTHTTSKHTFKHTYPLSFCEHPRVPPAADNGARVSSSSRPRKIE